METALDLAIRQAGGVKALGTALGISHQAVGHWKRAPALRVLAIERITGINRSLLRPDLYPPERVPRRRRNGERALA